MLRYHILFVLTFLNFKSSFRCVLSNNDLSEFSERHARFIYPPFVNISNLALQYAGVCGSASICNKTITANVNLPIYVQGCPQCDCSEHCHSNFNCCADVGLNSCVNPVVINSTRFDRTEQRGYRIVNTCVPSAPDHLIRRCAASMLDKTSYMENPPVKNTITGQFFYKYCAACHNITNIAQWKLDISCENGIQANLNLYSSSKALYDSFKRDSCLVKYAPIHTTLSPRIFCKYDNLVADCNVTGEWDIYDPDVEWACHHSYAPYNVYTSVFCFLCNSRPLLHGNESYPLMINNWCSLYATDNRAFPYKNYFCLNITEKVVWTDIQYVGLITESYDAGKAYPFSSFINFRRYEYGKLINSRIQGSAKGRFDILESKDMLHVNVAALHARYAYYVKNTKSRTIHTSWCRPEFSGRRWLASCQCQYECIAKRNCCPDYALTLSYFTRCVSSQLPSDKVTQEDKTFYTMISRCPEGFNDSRLQSLCEFNGDNWSGSLLSLFPVRKSTGKTLYKNIHCFECHELFHAGFKPPYSDKDKKILHTQQLQLSSLKVHCTKHSFLNRFQSLEWLLRYVLYADCILEFVSSGSMPWYTNLCLYQGRNISARVCNSTSALMPYNRDVKDLCENFLPPIIAFVSKIYEGDELLGNIFCDICRGKFQKEFIISECNVTGRWAKFDQSLYDMCANLPMAEHVILFKNKACELCNNVYYIPSTFMPVSGPVHTYKMLFSTNIIDSTDRNVKSVNDIEFREGEFYDTTKGIYRDVHCAVGNRPMKGTCIPLFQVTSFLTYVLYFKLQPQVGFIDTKLESTFLVIKNTIDYIRHFTSPTKLYIKYANVLSNAACMSRDEGNGDKQQGIYTGTPSTLTILVHAAFTTGDVSVVRQKLEKSLLAATEGVMIITIGHSNVSFRVTRDARAYILPAYMHTVRSQMFCKDELIRKKENYNTRLATTTLDVNDLLVCPQVKLSGSEFDLDNGGLTLRIHNTNRTLGADRFTLGIDHTAKVCVSDYLIKASLEGSVHLIDQVLTIITIATTCVSLLCLAATFLVYCVVSHLRSLPGKNIMATTFSLFIAQSSFLLKIIDGGRIFCRILGVIIHLSWLLTFCWMHVCSFHMFYIFNIRKLSCSIEENHFGTFGKYVLYSLFVPSATIILHIATSLYLSDGRSFGYDDGYCFISSLYGLLIAFYLPIIIISVTNIFFYVITLHRIRTSPRVSSSHNDRREITIYIKLFSITGITWFLQIVDGQFPTSPFSFLVTFFLQDCRACSYFCLMHVILEWLII